MFNVHLSVRRGIIGRVPARSSKIDPNLAKAEPCFKWGQNGGFGTSPQALAQKELVPVREVKRAEESHQCWNTLRGICSDHQTSFAQKCDYRKCLTHAMCQNMVPQSSLGALSSSILLFGSETKPEKTVLTSLSELCAVHIVHI